MCLTKLANRSANPTEGCQPLDLGETHPIADLRLALFLG